MDPGRARGDGFGFLFVIASGLSALETTEMEGLAKRASMPAEDRDHGGAEDDAEQHRQKESDHRHGEFWRQGRGFSFGFGHSHGAIFLCHYAQSMARFGKASCRERGCQNVLIQGVAGSYKKK